MADYNSDRTGANIDATLDKVDALVDSGNNVTADGLTVSNSASIATTIESTTTTVGFDLKDSLSFARITNSNGTFKIDSNDDGSGGTSDIVLAQSGVERLRIEDNGNVLFYEDTGTTAKMVWDAGAESLTLPDLKLSGGVYLGGTGAANKLDDYEEGTWTPAASSNVTVDLVHNAQYTKVGNLVNIQAWIKVSITASNPVLQGLPFSISGRTEASVSNVIAGEVITSQALLTSIYMYGATAGGTTEDMFINFSYVTA